MVSSKQSVNVEECSLKLRERVVAKAPSEVVLADSTLRAQIINDSLNDLDSSWYIIKVSCIGEKTILDLLKDHFQPHNVQIGLLLSCKACVLQILGGCRGSDG